MPPSIIIDSLPDVVTVFDVTVLLGVGVMLVMEFHLQQMVKNVVIPPMHLVIFQIISWLPRFLLSFQVVQGVP